MSKRRPGRRVIDWLAPVAAGIGFVLLAADVWAQGAPSGAISDALSGKWFDLVSSSPWMALCIYFIWDGRGEKNKRLDAYREGAAAAADTAESLRELARAFDALREEVRRR